MEPDWNRLLGGIPREKPPAIPIERLLERSRAPQRPLYLAAAVALVSLTLFASQFDSTEPEAPVHLQIDFVQASSADATGEASPAGSGTPESGVSESGVSGSGASGDPEEFDRP
jgi:hypothetical protein